MINKLRELAERAPDMCHPYGDAYDIGPYRFSFLSDGTLRASTGAAVEEGRPALDWLQGALHAAIKVRGWYLECCTWGDGEAQAMIITTPTAVTFKTRRGNLTEALLAALLAAVRGER